MLSLVNDLVSKDARLETLEAGLQEVVRPWQQQKCCHDLSWDNPHLGLLNASCY